MVVGVAAELLVGDTVDQLVGVVVVEGGVNRRAAIEDCRAGAVAHAIVSVAVTQQGWGCVAGRLVYDALAVFGVGQAVEGVVGVGDGAGLRRRHLVQRRSGKGQVGAHHLQARVYVAR